MTSLSFAHVGLNCRDLEATAQFYQNHFGFEVARTVLLGEAQRIVFLKLGDTYLELFQAEGESPTPPPAQDGSHAPGLRHIAFQVDSVDRKLAEMGNEAHITLGPLSFDQFISGWRSVWIADPDGNIIEISQGFADQSDHPPKTLPEGLPTDYWV